MKTVFSTAFVALCITGALAACQTKGDAKAEPDAATVPLTAAQTAQGDSAVIVDAAAHRAPAVADAAVVDADLAHDKIVDDLRWRKNDAIAGLATSCTWAPPVVPPPKGEGAGSYSARSGADALSFDCEDIEFGQACVYDPCANAADSCTAARAKDCRTCGQTCIDSCGACEAGCSDQACRAACASTTAVCHETCMKLRHDAFSAKCANLEDQCSKRMRKQWNDGQCDAVCKTYSDCREACSVDAGGNLEDSSPCAKNCRRAFTKACPGNGLDNACLANGGY